jgi:hypothetical protein
LEKQPETMLLQAQWEADPALWIGGELRVEGAPDVLPADNNLFFSLAPVVEGKVALLAQSQYLRLALSPEIMRGQWATRVLEPSKLSAELENNQDAEVLCIESNYLQSGDARKLLLRYLSNGRGVLLLVNRLTPAITGFLRELGFEVDGTVNPGKGGAERFQFIFSNHPIFHPFLSPEYGNLMEIKISKYVRLKSNEAMPLVFSEKGAGLFFQGAKLQGKLFVIPFGMDREHTSWPVHQTFIPFLDLTLQTARAEDATPLNFEPGEVAVIQLPAGSTVKEVVLRDGHGELAHESADHGRVQVKVPEKPGLYTITYDDASKPEKVLSVNPSPKESQLVYVESPEAMKLWHVNTPGQTGKATAGSAYLKGGLASILQQRFWWWMVLGSLGALMLETVLAETKLKVEN